MSVLSAVDRVTHSRGYWPAMGVLAVVCVLAFEHSCVSPAHAQGAGPAAVQSEVQSVLVQTVLPGIATALLTLVTALIPILAARLMKRWGVHVTQGQIDLLDKLAGQAIAYAEEKTAAAVKQNVLVSPKLNLAVSFLNNQAELAGIPAKLQDSFAELIHAKLGATPGVGASVTPAA